MNVRSLLLQFRQALAECRETYLAAAERCVEQQCLPAKYSADQFAVLMDDLHRGLLVKIFVSVGGADEVWSPEEQALAVVLFRHLWGREMTREELGPALGGIADRAASLSWDSLIGFFERLPPLREQLAPLNAIAVRLGNLLAKSDGKLAETEKLALRSMQKEFEHLQRLSLGEGPAEGSRRSAAQAVQRTRDETRELRRRIRAVDRPPPPAVRATPPKKTLAEARRELDQLIGMQAIKAEIRTLANFLQLKRHRAAAGMPDMKLSLHMVFTGNPGTGKTTVARIVGQLLGALGILQRGHLVETDRSGLVAEYAGQTGPKTNRKLDEALDGVLFIDEAYSLVAEEGDDSFGRESLQSLLKRMEDDRDRLVVILAGYPEPMERLLRSNPGLSSRFHNRLVFEDYSVVELAGIFEGICRQNRFVIDAETRARLLVGFQWLRDRRDEHFGNGRMVRNVFEDAVRRMANRIAGIARVTKKLLTELRAEDIPFPGVPGKVFERIEDRRFAVSCSGCGNVSRVPASYLGRRVGCTRCDHRFVAAWGEPCE